MQERAVTLAAALAATLAATFYTSKTTQIVQPKQHTRDIFSDMKHPSDRDDLHDILYSLQRFAIHPKYIESDNSILCELSQEHELDERTDIYINEDGVSIRHWNQNDFYDLVIGQETLMQLAAMSTCFAVGYAKAKYEAAEENRKTTSHDLPSDHNE